MGSREHDLVGDLLMMFVSSVMSVSVKESSLVPVKSVSGVVGAVERLSRMVCILSIKKTLKRVASSSLSAMSGRVCGFPRFRMELRVE